MKTNFQSVDEYIASQPEGVRRILEQVRSVIRKALPQAVEAISYQMPTYKLPAGPVLYFAGWKQHYSLYPASANIVEALQDELAPYEISKGTIRFPLAQPVPEKLIGRIARLRAKEVAGRGRAKRA
jgi:uncharacterized protein YdhG (YjbR/CyaY superfamily)